MDEEGYIAFAEDPAYLTQAAAIASNVSALAAPSSQPDFNSAGSFDPIAVLGGLAATVGKVGGAVQSVLAIPAQFKFNAAVQAQNQQLGLQTLATAGKIATLQNQTQLVRAQQEFAKAAGIAPPSSLVVLAAVAGVALLGLMVFRKK